MLSPKFVDVLRCCTAIQTAVFELDIEDVNAPHIAMPAMKKCLAELIKAVKELEKAVR